MPDFVGDREIIYSGTAVCLAGETVLLSPFGFSPNDKLLISVSIVKEEKDAITDVVMDNDILTVNYRRTWNNARPNLRYGLSFKLDNSDDVYSLRSIIDVVGKEDDYGFGLIFTVYRDHKNA